MAKKTIICSSVPADVKALPIAIPSALKNKIKTANNSKSIIKKLYLQRELLTQLSVHFYFVQLKKKTITICTYL